MIWVGTDDGNLQLTRDGGQDAGPTSSATCPGCPRRSWVSWVEASRFDAGTAYAAFDRHTFGDMTPWVYRTDRLRQDLDAHRRRRSRACAATRTSSRRTRSSRRSSSSAPSSACGSRSTAARTGREFKGGRLPERGGARSRRSSRASTIWCSRRTAAASGSSTTSRRCARSARTRCAKAAAFLPARPVQQRMPADGGWVEGDADVRRARTRRPARSSPTTSARGTSSGRIKLEVLDDDGQGDRHASRRPSGAASTASSWSMQVQAAARAARGAGRRSARRRGRACVPGTYTVRLTKGDEVIETKLAIGLDRRAPFDARRPQGRSSTPRCASHALFGDMSDAHRPHRRARAPAPTTRAKALAAGDPLRRASSSSPTQKLEEAQEEDRRHQGGRRHHRRGADPRAPRSRSTARSTGVGGPAGAVPGRAASTRSGASSPTWPRSSRRCRRATSRRSASCSASGTSLPS